MVRLNVKPTRMELSKLKQRLTVSVRGHKLLKDKQDELMRQFIELIRKNNELRDQVEKRLTAGMKSFVLAKATLEEAFIEELVAIPPQSVTLNLQEKNIMSVSVPEWNFTVVEQNQESDFKYGYLNSNSEIDHSIEEISAVLPDLLSLTEIEKNLSVISWWNWKNTSKSKCLRISYDSSIRRDDLLHWNEVRRTRTCKYYSYYRK